VVLLLAVLEEVEVEEEGGHPLFNLTPLILAHPTTGPSPWAMRGTSTPNTEEGEEEGEDEKEGAHTFLS